MLGIWKGIIQEGGKSFDMFQKEICIGNPTDKIIPPVENRDGLPVLPVENRDGLYFLVFPAKRYKLIVEHKDFPENGEEIEIFGFLSVILNRIFVCDKVNGAEHYTSLFSTFNYL